MNERNCETCANRETPWCKGCEYKVPGLDQFDFYQKLMEPKGDGQRG